MHLLQANIFSYFLYVLKIWRIFFYLMPFIIINYQIQFCFKNSTWIRGIKENSMKPGPEK